MHPASPRTAGVAGCQRRALRRRGPASAAPSPDSTFKKSFQITSALEFDDEWGLKSYQRVEMIVVADRGLTSITPAMFVRRPRYTGMRE